MSLGILLTLGLAVFGGMLGAWVFQKIRFPQVIGYIIIGLLLGESCFKLIPASAVDNLKSFNFFALGIIGFLVGGELKLDIFRRYAKQFTSILLFEGMASFLLVGAASFCVVHFLVGCALLPSIAAGLIFGAISSATDPASTIDVIWEYRAKGVMTTAIIAIVALDDALAMTLYGISTGVSQILNGNGSAGVNLFGQVLMSIVIELGGSLFLGMLFALVLVGMLKLIRELDRAVALIFGAVLLAIGLAIRFNLDVILASMAIGFVLVNLAPRRSEQIFKMMRSFAVPVYVVFFVLVGARLSFGHMQQWWLWALVGAYIFFRNFGKVVGSFFGAKLTGATDSVAKYLGLGIFAQGGVAIGLAIVASESLKSTRLAGGMTLSDAVIYVVTATTLLLQLFGPPMVKLALHKAGEAGRNITEEDVMAQMRVSDMVDPGENCPLHEADSLEFASEEFTAKDNLIYPVLNRHNQLCGIITFESLKDVLGDRDSWNWLLVADVMQPISETALSNEGLKDAYDRMLQLHFDQLPIVDGNDRQKVLGVLDVRAIRRRVQSELLKIN